MAEELSLKPITELLGLAFRVAFTICISVSGAGWPSRTSWAPKNQCRLHNASTCSLAAALHRKRRKAPQVVQRILLQRGYELDSSRRIPSLCELKSHHVLHTTSCLGSTAGESSQVAGA